MDTTPSPDTLFGACVTGCDFAGTALCVSHFPDNRGRVTVVTPAAGLGGESVRLFRVRLSEVHVTPCDPDVHPGIMGSPVIVGGIDGLVACAAAAPGGQVFVAHAAEHGGGAWRDGTDMRWYPAAAVDFGGGGQ